MLLIDRVISGKFQFYSHPDLPIEQLGDYFVKLRERIGQCAVIRISNVADYFWQNEQMAWDLTEIPNVAPPFSSMWFEYEMPQSVETDRGTLSIGGAISRVGVFVEAIEPEKGQTHLDTRWFVSSSLLVESTRGIGLFGGMQLFVTPQGTVVHMGDTSVRYGLPMRDPALAEIWKGAVFSHSLPAFLSIAFMHCKNVKFIPHDPSMNVHRHRLKPSRKPRVRYHTLEITPMKEILRKEGGSEHNGLKMALHICRGYFKDYTHRGLFGKVKGLFWWDAHVRGSVEEGVVDKDYKVNQPREVTP